MHAYVLKGHNPGQTLRLASRAFKDSGQMATVLDARYQWGARTFTYASAGHPPPLVLRGGDAFFADLQPGPPIGFGAHLPRTHSLSLEPGDTVVLCTDGLFDELADALLNISLSGTNDDACLVALRT